MDRSMTPAVYATGDCLVGYQWEEKHLALQRLDAPLSVGSSHGREAGSVVWLGRGNTLIIVG